MKKLDLVLIVMILTIAAVFFGFNYYKSYLVENSNSDIWAEIYVGGELNTVIPLKNGEEDYEIMIESDDGKNVVKVHNQGLEVIEADCPDHICESSGFIDKPGQIIVCLPHKVVVEIKGEAKEDINGIS